MEVDSTTRVENKTVQKREKKSGCQNYEQIGVSKRTGPPGYNPVTCSSNGLDKSRSIFSSRSLSDPQKPK